MNARRFRHADLNAPQGLVVALVLRAVFWTLVIVGLATLLGGCATNPVVVEVKLSYDTRETTGRQPTATIRVRQYFGREPGLRELRWFGEYEHDSSLRDGWPFNNRNDSNTIDSFGGGFAVPLWRAR